MINIQNFQSDLLKIDKKPYKDFDIYYIGYITSNGSNLPIKFEDWIAGLFTDTKYGSMKKTKIMRTT